MLHCRVQVRRDSRLCHGCLRPRRRSAAAAASRLTHLAASQLQPGPFSAASCQHETNVRLERFLPVDNHQLPAAQANRSNTQRRSVCCVPESLRKARKPYTTMCRLLEMCESRPDAERRAVLYYWTRSTQCNTQGRPGCKLDLSRMYPTRNLNSTMAVQDDRAGQLENMCRTGNRIWSLPLGFLALRTSRRPGSVVGPQSNLRASVASEMVVRIRLARFGRKVRLSKIMNDC